MNLNEIIVGMTQEQRVLETLRAYNGYGRDVHEIVLVMNPDGTPLITVGQNGVGALNWRRVTAQERNEKWQARNAIEERERDYVLRVENQSGSCR